MKVCSQNPALHYLDHLLDASAVAVKEEHEIVGHVPFNIASVISHFLTRDCNKGFVEVTGSEVNHVAGYGLEIPCIYVTVHAEM